MGLEEDFKETCDWVAANAMPCSNDEKLECYGYFKQVNVGDVEGDQPWQVQFEARSKWDAWNAVKGMAKEEAMQKYVDTVAVQRKKYEM
jgi:diazepam-binding inhibitor (GABA receptor modulator, acyl-CoA-binding protein)